MMNAEKSSKLHKKVITFLVITLSLFLSFEAQAAGESEAARKLIDQARQEMNMENYTESKTLFVQALDVAQKDGDHEAESICLGNLGTLSDAVDDDDLAIHYYKRGYDLALKTRNEMLQLKFAASIVKKYTQMRDVNSARRWQDIMMSLPYDKDPKIHFLVLYTQSGLHLLENDYVSAIYSLNQARDVVEANNLGAGDYGAACMAMGDIMYKTKRYKEAINEYMRGYDSIRSGGSRAQEVMACRALYLAYKQVDNQAKAAYYRKKYLALNDSVFEKRTEEEANKKLFDYEQRWSNSFTDYLNRDFFIILICIVILGVAVFFSVRASKTRRNHLKMLESSLFMAQQEETKKIEKLEKKEKEVDKLENLYEEIKNKAQKPESPMTPEQRQELLDKINVVMSDLNVICSENFSLTALAKLTGSNTKYVSRVINDTYGKSFKAYLNEFRIKEACRRLIDTEKYGHLTIKAIHQELGFQTATSFVAAFKKEMGMKPSEYKRLHLAPGETATPLGDEDPGEENTTPDADVKSPT